MSAIPLSKARMCCNCDVIHSEKQCPKCESKTYVWVSSWLHSKARKNITTFSYDRGKIQVHSAPVGGAL